MARIIVRIITLTKQMDNRHTSDTTGPVLGQGVGAPDKTTNDICVEMVARELMDHFNSRWGQEIPLSAGEARLVSNRLLHSLAGVVP